MSLVQNVMVESNWIADSTGNYELFGILESENMKEMFSDTIQYVIDGARQNASFCDKLQEYINDKEKAFKGLPLEKRLDSVYLNTAQKASIGLVYTPYELAEELVAQSGKKQTSCTGKIFVFLKSQSERILNVGLKEMQLS